ncbi:MAG TPA: DMT family transporter [Casimicrobiaceae bacterium]|nr:DMT family transporter [Casimicrobiaceae bacterium]
MNPRGAGNRLDPYTFAPALFVVLWSTGFIAAKFGLPYAPPLKFLLYRFVLVALLMLLVCLATRARWPARREDYAGVVIAGLLVHGVYLGGVFIAISRGMSAGTAAMLTGLQPVVTVFIARSWLGERVVARQWLGLVLGLVGVWLVVRQKIDFDGDLVALTAVLASLAAISVGTIWQKQRASHIDLRSGAVIQFSACALVYLPLVLAFEVGIPVHWTPSFTFAIGWSVLVLSLGAITVLYLLLRHGAAAGVARLFYLVPPVTALFAWLLFEERLDALALAGMVVIAIAVALARPRTDV